MKSRSSASIALATRARAASPSKGLVVSLFRIASCLAPLLIGAVPSDARADDAKPLTADEYLAGRFEKVKQLIRLGDYGTAYRLADALLLVAPEVPFRSELQRLRRLAEGRHLGANLLGACFEFTPGDRIFPRRSLLGSLVVENLTEQVLEIGASRGSSVIGQARFRLTECYADGSEWSTEGTRNVTVESPFKLGPGEVQRIPIRLELPAGGASPVLQRFVVRGTFNATHVQRGAEPLPRSLPWQEFSQTTFREDLDVVREDPYKHLQLGLLGFDSARSVVAIDLLRAQLTDGLLDEDQQDRVVDLLTGCLDDSNSGINAVLFRLLERFTGVRCEPRTESWRLWAGLRKGGRARD
ncbi:MAG: hypothetical protein AB7O52_13895 [Planctomycetota bacterium]